jgi:alkylation response protein AidB-like acyl-CoA dehydrogenase
MDFDLSEGQKMLKRTARDFLIQHCPKSYVREMETDEKGYSSELWLAMVELGWLGLPFPQKYCGNDGSFLDLVVLLEEMGRACLPGPFFPTVVLGGLTILDVGSEQQKQQLLPAIAGGTVLTLALTEADGKYDAASIQTKATRERGALVVCGTKVFVPDAHVAEHLLCMARTKKDSSAEEGLTLLIVDAHSEGINYTPLLTISGDKQFEVVLDTVRVPASNIVGGLDLGWQVMERTLQRAAVAKSAEILGAAQQVLEMTLDHAKKRVQFDRPLASFQAVRHHLADMLIDIDSTRFTTYEGASLLTNGLPAGKEAAMAKARASEAIRRITALGHRIHGGVGYVLDHDMQLYFRRGKAAEVMFGGADLHREAVACHLGL